MTRESPKNNSNKTTNRFHTTKSNSNNDNYHRKIVNFEPFCLFSSSDKSLKKAIELVESSSINRSRVCVVSVISKDTLDESAKNYLVQSILSENCLDKKTLSKVDNKTIVNNPSQQSTEPIPSTTIKKSVSKEVENFSNDSNVICDDEDNFENQVIGHVDSKIDVIVLNLTSFLEMGKLEELGEKLSKELSMDEISATTLLDVWPKWNQNLLKTLLILFLMSHIIVFYNPDPSIDYNLIEIFRILEILRLKSQTRISHLLEVIASKQVFSQQWIRHGRIACPKALFVCDTSYLNYQVKQSDIIYMKRDLEDQIYKVLKRSQILHHNIIQTSNNSTISQNQSTLLCLPEHGDFVFIITRYNPNYKLLSSPNVSSRSFDSGMKTDGQPSKQGRNEFYSKLFKSLNLDSNLEDDGDNKQSMSSTDVSDTLERLTSSTNNTIDGQQQSMKTKTSKDKEIKESPVKTTHHKRFKKFLQRHIADVHNSIGTVNSHSENHQDVNKNNSKKSSNQLIMPRYDDFFTVLLRLKNLLFPNIHKTIAPVMNDVITTNVTPNDCKLMVPNNEISLDKEAPDQDIFNTTTTCSERGSSSLTETTSFSTTITIDWNSPDERKFIDIYDLVNYDELFSKVHCYKTRITAYDFYIRNLKLQPMQQVTHESCLESAKLFYLHHARGLACSINLELFLEQCNQYWENCKYLLDKNNQLLYNTNKTKGSHQYNISNRHATTRNSSIGELINNLNPSSGLMNSNDSKFKSTAFDVSSRLQNNQKAEQSGKQSQQTSTLFISRRSKNCLKVSTLCCCNKMNHLLITPSDKGKKLDRLDIKHLES